MLDEFYFAGVACRDRLAFINQLKTNSLGYRECVTERPLPLFYRQKAAQKGAETYGFRTSL